MTIALLNNNCVETKSTKPTDIVNIKMRSTQKQYGYIEWKNIVGFIFSVLFIYNVNEKIFFLVNITHIYIYPFRP
jgi:hypothetical protein